MPEHGLPTAQQACCRPPPPSAPQSLPPAFWSSAPAWRRAARNTSQCLFGCAVGDIAAMTLVPLWWPSIHTGTLMAVAILAGITSSVLLETVVLRVRERFDWARALRTALGMSLLSMVAMEVVMNLVDWSMMGGQRLHLHDPRYWLAWGPALVMGFLAALPYNYFMLRRHGRSCH